MLIFSGLSIAIVKGYCIDDVLIFSGLSIAIVKGYCNDDVLIFSGLCIAIVKGYCNDDAIEVAWNPERVRTILRNKLYFLGYNIDHDEKVISFW